MKTGNKYPLPLFLLIFFLFLSGFGCQEKERLLPEHRGGQIYQGKVRMDIKCYGCHGWRGEGSMHAPALSKGGRTVPYFDFSSAVIYGRGMGMPAYHRALSEKDIRLIIDWLQQVSILRPAE